MQSYSDEELIEEIKRRFKSNKQYLKEQKLLLDQLQTVNKKLQESEAVKSHFLSNIRNEIINPFTSILALSGSILQMDESQFAKVKQMSTLIHSEAFELDFQLKNIFTAAAIEAGECVPEIVEVHLHPLIQELIHYFQHKLEQKQLSLVWECSQEIEMVSFRTDPEKLNMVLLNLFSNAIKFSPVGAEIILETNIENQHLVCRLHDKGMGFDKNAEKRLFNRFNTLDPNSPTTSGGHGLGLSIVKSLVELLGGSLSVTSKKQKGSSFQFQLPQGELNSEGFADEANEIFFSPLKF